MAENSKMSLWEAFDATASKINKVTICEGKDAEHSEAVVCTTVESLPIPHCKAVIENCSQCSNRIWVALNSPKTPPRICYHCYVTKVKTLNKDEGIEISINREGPKQAFAKGKFS